MPASLFRHWTWVFDLLIVTGIVIAGIAVGGSYRNAFFQSGLPQELPQYHESGAAIALACGQGFIDTGYAPSEAVAQFLDHKRDAISCADLPPGLPPLRPNLTQGLYRYLMSAAALVWVLTGSISWSGLTPMFAVAYAATLACAYGLFRCLMGRVMSLVATLALLGSAVHLGYLPYFHDYAKAPFILGLMLLMARLARRPLTWRRALVYGAVFGIVLGIGFGFRNDILINVLPWAAVVVLCTQGPVRANLAMKAACLAISAASFAIVAWPILTAYSRGSNTGHVAYLGLMTPFDGPMGIGGSIYNFGYVYSDGFAAWNVDSFSRREHGRGVGYLTPEYDRAMFDLVFRIARRWPADILARAYASMLAILDDLPFGVGQFANAVPPASSPRAVAFYQQQAPILTALHGLGVVSVLLALVILSARSVRTAAALLLLLIYFTGYPALQFHVRHFFHLEFVAWGAMGFVIERAIVALWRAGQAVVRQRLPVSRAALKAQSVRIAAFAMLAVVILPAPLVAARWYQTRSVSDYLESAYLGASREALALQPAPAGPGMTLLTAPTLFSERVPGIGETAEYVVVEFSSKACEVLDLPVTFRYEPEPLRAEMSHLIHVSLSDGGASSLVFHPVFFHPQLGRFTGIEVNTAHQGCVASVSRIPQSRTPPVTLGATFSPNWKQAKLFQTLSKFESPFDGEPPRPPRYFRPATLSISKWAVPAPFVAPDAASAFFAAIVRRTAANAFAINGKADTDFTQLVLIDHQQLPAAAVVTARGHVYSGGLTLGLTRAGAWVTTVNVAEHGDFEAAVATTEAGDYAVVVANLPDRWGAPTTGRPWTELLREWLVSKPTDITRIDITSLGWVAPAPAASR